jgi:chromosome segregation ATPase
MTNSNRNVSSKYEEERLRAAEQSQIVYLQGQIDEVRRLLKDQANRNSTTLEQIRKVEGGIGQLEGLVERHRAEVTQANDISRRDIAVLRREVAAALIKIDEGVRPIREMQAQIQQIAEVRKQDRDHVAGWLVRIEDLEQRITAVAAQIRDVDERYRGLGGRLDGFTIADEALRVEVRKISEDLQVEKQSLRRQAIEAQQLVTDLRPTLDEHTSRIDRLEEIRQRIDIFAEQLPGQISELDVRLVEQIGEIRRVERLSTERFLMNQDRLEQIRQQQDEKIVTLQETDDRQLRQLTSWMERLDSWTRELEQRQGRIATQIEVVERAHSGHLSDLEQRDVKLIEAMLEALRSRIDLIKAEQIERGRTPQDS